MDRSRLSEAPVLAVALLLAPRVALGAPEEPFFSEPVHDIIIDAFIISSPFAAFVAFVMALDDRWRLRPRDWRDWHDRQYAQTYAYKWLSFRQRVIVTAASLAAIGIGLLLARFIGAI